MTSPGSIQGPKRAPGAGALPSSYASGNQSGTKSTQNVKSSPVELVARMTSNMEKAIAAGETARAAGQTARAAGAAAKDADEKAKAFGAAKRQALSEATIHAERAQNARQNAQVARHQVVELEGGLAKVQTEKAILADKEREIEAKKRQLEMKMAALKAYQANQRSALKQVET